MSDTHYKAPHLFEDGIAVKLGTDADASLTHSGSALTLVNATGNTTIQSSGATSSLIAKLGTTTSATKFAVQDSAGTELFSVGGGGAMTFPGDITFADSSTIAVSGSSGGNLTLTLDAVNAGAGEGRLALNADEQIDLNDGTATITLDGGALSETALGSADITPSGAMTMRGGGVSQFGDDTGYVSFDGAGAASTSGITTLGLTPSGNFTVTCADLAIDPTGNATLSMDATKNITVNIADNEDAALLIQEGANSYLEVDTQNAQARVIVGNATTNPVLDVLGTGQVTLTGNVDALAGLDVTGAITGTSTIATAGNSLTLNSDATAAATNAPFIEWQDGDAVAPVSDDLVKSRMTLDAVNEVIELSLTRQRNGGAVAQVGAHLSIGRVGEVTTSVDALLDLRSVNDASAARVATLTHLGQEGAVELSSPTAGLDFALIGAGEAGIKGSAADAQHSASFSGSQVNLGAGGASAPDWVAARQAASVVEMASGDSFYSVGTSFIGRRALAADANPTAAFSANGIELGAGGATAPTVSLAFQAANIAELGSGDSLYAVTGTLGVRALSADANATASLSASSLSLGVGGATAVDWVLSRQAANIAEMVSGDSLFSVGASSIGRRNASADANFTAAITANGVELGAGGGTSPTWAIAYSAANVAALAAGDSLSISNTGELINDRYTLVTVVATGAAGANDGTLTGTVKTLDGTAVARAKKIKIVANSTDGSGETLDASITFSAATIGSIVTSGAGFAYILSSTAGTFACTLTNSADDSTYVSAMTSDGGVAVAGQGCVVVESVIDSATWTA